MGKIILDGKEYIIADEKTIPPKGKNRKPIRLRTCYPKNQNEEEATRFWRGVYKSLFFDWYKKEYNKSPDYELFEKIFNNMTKNN